MKHLIARWGALMTRWETMHTLNKLDKLLMDMATVDTFLEYTQLRAEFRESVLK
ncbi:hypothetical protein UFOVP621_80 [uncultured Caudovirales phage]|uniref:Uncharacterized protein n=1 Tax=uncultured Caudovirales phage TaxID=2100421 RepID=A0A6J5N2I7_9CAUD|nr:hypothetical protein UFOVP621_80 [uncultured Caudovirales phage]